MKKRETFTLAVCAGLMIAVGGTVYLSVENKVAGALLFTVGLYAIVLNDLFLYTGKIGYLGTEENKKEYVVVLGLTWLGNLVGTMLGAFLLRCTRAAKLSEAAAKICEVKLRDQPVSILILAFFCGILMYIAVDGYRQSKNPIILFLCVSVFILCGFEHCIANMFYFTLAGAWSAKTVFYLIIMTIGNSLGGILIPAVKR